MKVALLTACLLLLNGCTSIQQCLQRHGYTYCHTWVGRLPMGLN